MTTKHCLLTAGFTAITTAVAAALAIILAGIIGIICAKYRIYKLEQEEYRRFQDEYKGLHELNPIYKDPVSTYRNPMRTKTD